MGLKIEHVRFRLSALIDAVRVRKGLPSDPDPSEALGWYWGWAVSRGWKLAAVTNQLDPNRCVLRTEDSDQVEIASEEHWNVIWQADDVTDGGADFIADSAATIRRYRETELIEEMIDRGWERYRSESVLKKEGNESVSFQAISEAATSAIPISDIADEIELESEIR